MVESINRTISEFIRVCDDLLDESSPPLTTHEMNILEGYMKELTERFFKSP